MVVTISDAVAEASIVPELGAGVASYDLLIDRRRDALFRPCRKPLEAHPFDLALNLLVPWSNRISGGGCVFGGEFYRLEPNLPGEVFPIHGNAFSSPWKIESRASTKVMLSLESTGPGPFRYTAKVTYELRGGALTVRLGARNTGRNALPFGLGLHPWLPRTPQTLLMAKSERVTLENRDHLPAGDVDIRAREDWNFVTPRKLASGSLDQQRLSRMEWVCTHYLAGSRNFAGCFRRTAAYDLHSVLADFRRGLFLLRAGNAPRGRT